MRIEELAQNEVFVFGSNAHGHHGAGAALMAYERFGAVWGVGTGLQGQSYGIDTMSGFETMAAGVAGFLAFARSRPDLRFLVTPIGTGIAGHGVREVAGLFLDVPDNVLLPPRFLEALGR